MDGIADALEGLVEQGLCDEDTRDSLARTSEDNFIREEIADINAIAKAPPEVKKNIEQITLRLLTLSTLASSPEKQQIENWLQDPKRRFLFRHSNQNDIYLELLQAKANQTLTEYRQAYNPQCPTQENWAAEKSLKVIVAAKEENITPIKQKFDAIVEQSDNGIFDELKKMYLTSRKEVGEIKKQKSKSRKIRIGLLEDIMVDFKVKVSEHLDIDDDDMPYAGMDMFVKPHTETLLVLREVFDIVKEEYEKERNFIDTVFNSAINSGSELLFTEDLRFFNFGKQENEITALQEQIDVFKRTHLSEKIKPGQELEYELSLSEKDPLDVRFGNDGGCCIGVYDTSKIIGNAYCLPHIIADNATYVFNITQKTKEAKNRRVGIVLAFRGTDDNGNSILTHVLLCNSLELSASMNPANALTETVEYVEEELINFVKSRKFTAAYMSAHEYNTSQNYSKRSKEKPKRTIPGVRKIMSLFEIGSNGECIYSEILDQHGRVKRDEKDEGLYVLYEQ
ncbi:hypothetical protein HY486_00560 [Candidatus Woesearchaeota archaeon]|nr:hypothetical protein [Candidatus Woesearchaeota archaeon]